MGLPAARQLSQRDLAVELVICGTQREAALLPPYWTGWRNTMRSLHKALLGAAVASGVFVFSAVNASAAIVCNGDNVCWHAKEKHNYRAGFRKRSCSTKYALSKSLSLEWEPGARERAPGSVLVPGRDYRLGMTMALI